MINVGVMFGAKSTEHEVSILTAYQIIHALDSSKYQVSRIYITKDNDFYLVDEKVQVTDFANLDYVLQNSKPIAIVKHGYKIKKHQCKLDVVILATHGTCGEDGMLPALLDIYDISYVGSNHLSSSVAQDKVFFKQILSSNHLNVIHYDYLYDYQYLEGKMPNVALPCIIKPAKQGSSIGIGIAKTAEQLKQALELAFTYDDKVIIEEYLEGIQEINCAVRRVFNQIEVSLLEEVFKEDALLSFADKYQTKNGNKRRINIQIPQEQLIKEMATKTFQILGLSGVARIDLIIHQDQVYINEINAIPGSLSFYLWDIAPSKLLDDLIKSAHFIHQKKQSKTYAYQSNILNINASIKK